MEILVTGGAGFQGSHLTESLLANGHWVTVLDKSSRNAVRNMQGFRSHDRAAFISGSVTDGQTIDRAVRDHHVVFHLAAHVNVDQSLGDPESFLETNVMGTYRVLEAVRRYRNRLIYVSTCEVYGDGHNLKEGERLDEHAELKPNSPYGASKAAADRLCYSYFRSYGLDVTIVRPFNIFGVRQKAGRFGALIPRLVRQGINGEGLTIFGAGSATRDYLYGHRGRVQPGITNSNPAWSGHQFCQRERYPGEGHRRVCCGQVRCQDRAPRRSPRRGPALSR